MQFVILVISFFIGFYVSAYLHEKYDEEDFIIVIIVVSTILFFCLVGFCLGYLVFK